MNQSSDLVDEIISDGESCQIENPCLITNKPLYRYLKSITFAQRSIYDIRLRFEASDIWNQVSKVLSREVNGGGVSKNSNLQVMKIDNLSKDISFFPVVVDNLYINIRIHNGSGTQISLLMDGPPMAQL